MEERISPQRILFLIATILASFAGAFYLCYRHIEEQKIFLCLIIVVLIMVLCAFLLAIYDRRKEKIYYYGTDYSKVFLMTVLAWGAVIGGSFLPTFYFPAGILVFIMAGVMETASAVAMAVIMCLILYVSAGDPAGVFLTYSVLCVYAGMISDFMKKSEMKRRIASFFLMFPVLILIPAVFYYDTYSEIGVLEAEVFGGGALLTSLFAVILFPLLHHWISREKKALYDTILDEEHPLLVELKEFSMKEYAHALKVCQLSRLCAIEIGADADLAAAGGLFYRVGKIYGEPEIENALASAYKYRFPRELMVLMGEYGAVRCKPSSPESAIVHMVDALVLKIEALEENGNAMESDWNQDMVIYQTMNDLSQKGIYDESGVTMNQFLEIRKCLVREGKLI